MATASVNPPSVSPPSVSVIPPSQTLTTRQALKFQQFRNDREHIDFTIVSNGREFPCHQIILAASSSFLEAMMRTEMKEARTQQANLDVIPPAIVTLLIDHMYQQQVTVSHDLLRETIIASDYLNLEEMKATCISLAQPVINPANALLWWQTAEKFEIDELKAKCTEIINTSLPEISKSPEFLQLDLKEVSPYLDATKKTIDPDDQLEATIDWVSHRPEERTNHMDALIEKINLLKCSIECLETEMETRAELFQRCPTSLVKITRSCIQLAKQGGARKKRNKKGSKATSIVIIGGQENARDFNKTCWELTETMTLQQLCEIPDGHGLRCGVCKTSLGFVVSGGQESVKCSLFITSTKTWISLRSFQQARHAHGSIFMKERIFLFGGNISGGSPSSVISLEVDDVDEGEWQQEPALPFAVQYPEVACVEVDGRSRPFLLDTETNKLISMDMENNVWITKASMPGKKCFGARMISVNGKLLVAGATNRYLAWYSPDSDTWLTGTAPSLSHHFGALVSHGQSAYLLGGSLDSVEEYKIDEESWCTSNLRLPKQLYNLHALALDI